VLVKRFLATIAIPVAALGLVACGDDDDDDSGTTAATSVDGTEPSDDTEVTDDTDDGTDDTEGGTDGTSGNITLPDVSMPDLSLPGGTLPGGITIPSLPDISIPDISVPDMNEILTQIFPNLSEEQVSCLSDALGDVGTDIDPNQVMDLFDDCDIDPSDILGGG
jgi:hypothetical protein